jgi:glycerate 2-kinase
MMRGNAGCKSDGVGHGREGKDMNLMQDMVAIQERALEAVNPRNAVARCMHWEGQRLKIDSTLWNVGEFERIIIIAVGKASVPMAEEVVKILGCTRMVGCVVTKHGHALLHALPEALTIIESGHPIPDAEGIKAARRITALLEKSTEQDLVLLLLSGGGSALLPAPVPGLTLVQLQLTTDALLRGGATIGELNAVRKHISTLKGGQLARLASPSPVVALILSDVVGDPIDVIASGPTSPDSTSYETALNILDRYHITGLVPSAVIKHLEDGAAQLVPETPKPFDDIFSKVTNVIVGSNKLAAQAAVQEASVRGYNALLLSTYVEGEAREVGKIAAAIAKGIRYGTGPLTPPACIVWGGETTVTVRGGGKGGRNQELALSAAMAMEGLENVLLLALATDGTDGPTDSAGAIVDGQSAALARNRGWDLHAILADNNSYPLLDDIGALLRLGPTGTNVNDLMVLMVA